MNAVAARTGFNPAVLRAWERRHGLLQPRRTEGGHRLYTEDDVRVLDRVRALLEDGQSIGEIASLGRARLLDETPAAPAAAPDGGGVAPPLPAAPTTGAAPHRDLGALVQRLVWAAVRIDEPEVEAALDEAFATVSAQAAIEGVVLPTFGEIGRLWGEGRCGVAGEHLVSTKVVGRLLSLLRDANPVSIGATRQAVCACLPDEPHEIGVLLAAYTLARHGYRVTYLGARLPFEDLQQAIDQLRPDLVCLSASRATLLEANHAPLLEIAARLARGARLLIGGRGVPDVGSELQTGLEAGGVTLVRFDGPQLVELLA